jgi:hypothetical protein
MNPVALFDVLDWAKTSLHAAECGDTRTAEAAYMEAAGAALAAFPDGSAEAAALNVILGAVGEAARGVAA